VPAGEFLDVTAAALGAVQDQSGPRPAGPDQSGTRRPTTTGTPTGVVRQGWNFREIRPSMLHSRVATPPTLHLGRHYLRAETLRPAEHPPERAPGSRHAWFDARRDGEPATKSGRRGGPTSGLWSGPPGSARRPRCRPALPGGCHPPLLGALQIRRKRRRAREPGPRLGEARWCGGRLGRVGQGLRGGSEAGQAGGLAASQAVGPAAGHGRSRCRAGRAAAFGFLEA
jgi:hypothetical protein